MHQASNTVTPAATLGGVLRPPGDKSISHRVVLMASAASGVSAVRGFLASEDCLHTLRAMGALGASAHVDAQGTLRIEGTGGRFLQPVAPLDLGNSGTGLRLLAGFLAGRMLDVTLTGDASLRRRPMRRIRDPLNRMGASVELLGGHGGTAPVRVQGRNLRGIAYDLPVASAQVKSCVLLAALCAKGPTVVREPAPTRDHTERLFRAMGIDVDVAGPEIRLEGAGPAGPAVRGTAWDVPGDLSSAAFWVAACAAREGARLTVEHVGLNPRRTAVLDVLERMGASIERRPLAGSDAWEPAGTLVVSGRALRGTTIGGAEIPNLIDELPVLAVAAALAEGETVIRDAAELRVKESDRIRVMCENLRRMGVGVEERGDGMTIRGPARLNASSELRSEGDHRVAMAMAVLALSGPAPSSVRDVACVDTSYPAFWEDLAALSGQAGPAAGDGA